MFVHTNNSNNATYSITTDENVQDSSVNTHLIT